MRNLATIQIIKELEPIKDADRIELAKFKDIAWQVVVEKNKYKAGDFVIYCEIDSFIPNTIAPFLTKPDKEPKEYNCIKGERLRTIKLKGTLSQGLVLSTELLKKTFDVGKDVTEELGIIKYDTEETDSKQEYKPKSKLFKFLMRYKISRNIITHFTKKKEAWLSFLSKTDEVRIQSLVNEFESWKNTIGWSATEKLDGQSATFFSLKKKFPFMKKAFGVCSRNIWLKTPHTCNWWNIAKKLDIEKRLAKIKSSLYIQGEIVGPGIQKNKYNLKELDLYIFNIKNLTTGKQYTNYDVSIFCEAYGFKMVPIIHEHLTMPNTIDEVLLLAEGKSMLNQTEREGLVIRRGNISFKAISNKFLLKCSTDTMDDN